MGAVRCSRWRRQAVPTAAAAAQSPACKQFSRIIAHKASPVCSGPESALQGIPEMLFRLLLCLALIWAADTNAHNVDKTVNTPAEPAMASGERPTAE